MCLIVFAYKSHPKYKFIFAANRDEFHDRPTKDFHYWEDKKIFAGKDLKEGGTWMGFNEAGKFAAITNFRDMKNIMSTARSRGEIITNYLSAEIDSEKFLCDLQKKSLQYNGFNILLGSFDELYYYSNQLHQYEKLKPGVYGLSNHLLDTPWHKIEKSKNIFSNLLRDNEINSEEFFKLLRNEEKSPENQLPETGIGKEWEIILSSIFIRTENYGTRSSTLLSIDNNDMLNVCELSFDKNGNEKNRFENQVQIIS